MSTDDLRLSRLMSFALRHRPEDFGLAMDAAGWVDLDALVAALTREQPCTADDVRRVVRESDKRRFEIAGESRIRAVQGHSVPVTLGHPESTPPARLFHGTVARRLASIRAQGLRARGRNDVHLSATEAAACEVGARRGVPVVLVIDSAAMAREGHVFRLAPNGVWLTREVPPQFLAVLGEAERDEG